MFCLGCRGFSAESADGECPCCIALTRAAALGAELAETREALLGVLALIDSGYFVRDISRDMETGWALKQLGPVMTLGHAARLVATLRAAEEGEKNG